MNIPDEFKDIRPYSPEELPQIFEELLADPAFKEILGKFMPHLAPEKLADILRQCHNNLDVQVKIFHGLLHGLMDSYTDGFDLDTSSITDKQQSYTFISNHRDIVLDPGFISVGLIDNGFPTTVEIAIGDNLLIYPWIKKLVRVNKSFIVQRGLSMKQMLEASALMSRYIHFAITEKKENIWIAQREGRAKDSDDHTQESVLKMLAIGGQGDTLERLMELHIVPTALSYEYDPCDFLKAKEMQLKRDVQGYKKTQQDDLLNMQTGIFGYKGRVHFQTASCINPQIQELRGLSKPELFSRLASIIDGHIFRNYRLYPGNYVACDLLNRSDKFSSHYSAHDREKFEHYLQKQIARIDLPDKDEAFLLRCMLTMYANPVINHFNALKA